MKPRRWYSSPETNPNPCPPLFHPMITHLHLRYTGKVRAIHHGPILNKGSGRKVMRNVIRTYSMQVVEPGKFL